MPTAKDITALRKNGQLAEAFDLAMELLIAEPDNIWTKRAMGWVRFERLKAVAKSKASNEFMQEWVALSSLVADNPADEVMLTNQAIWQVVSHLFALGDSNKANDMLTAVFASIQHWSFERPSDLYSALLRAFLKAGKMWPSLYEFLRWWQLSNLRPEDYLLGITNEGKKMMSTAEQAYIAYAKQVLLHPEHAATQALIADLETLHEQHPEYQYPPYYQAKLLVATGSKEEAIKALMPFARRKEREFWLWDLLANLYDDELDKAIACLCRAVSCSTQEKFLVNARLNLAVKLNEASKFNEALTELAKSVKTRQDEGWNVGASYTDAVEKLVKKGAVILDSNKALYRQYRPVTDELLYADIPEQIGVVTFLNTDKKVAHFNVSRTVSGHFKYVGSMAHVQPGDFVAVRLEEKLGKEGIYWVPLSAKLTERTPSEEVFRTFRGPIKRADGKGFGFVGDVFIPPALLKGVEQDSLISGSALVQFEKAKNKYGWRAFRITN